MAFQVLETKLYIPHPRDEIPLRHHLIDRLEDGVNNKLILITAPAGYGKSTLVSGWANQHQDSVAWLSLEQLDNDVNRFMSYMIAALQTIRPEIGEEALSMLRAHQQVSVETILTTLISDIVLEMQSKANSDAITTRLS